MAVFTIICPHCGGMIKSGAQVPLGRTLQCLQCCQNFTVEEQVLAREGILAEPRAPQSTVVPVAVGVEPPPTYPVPGTAPVGIAAVVDGQANLSHLSDDVPPEDICADLEVKRRRNDFAGLMGAFLGIVLLGAGAAVTVFHFLVPPEEPSSIVQSPSPQVAANPAQTATPTLPSGAISPSTSSPENFPSSTSSTTPQTQVEQETKPDIEPIRQGGKKRPIVPLESPPKNPPANQPEKAEIKPAVETPKTQEQPNSNNPPPSTVTKPVRPPEAQLALTLLPPLEQQRVQAAVARGANWLLSRQNKDGTWQSIGHGVGYAALPALTLLECGAHPHHPAVQKAAEYVRTHSAKLGQTYDLGLAIMFLDRLGDPRDRPLIQILALRLIAGQLENGGWGYTCPLLTPEENYHLYTFLTYTRPVPILPNQLNKDPGMPNPLEKGGTLPNPLDKTASIPNPLEKPSAPFPNPLEKGGSFPNPLEKGGIFPNPLEKGGVFPNPLEKTGTMPLPIGLEKPNDLLPIPIEGSSKRLPQIDEDKKPNQGTDPNAPKKAGDKPGDQPKPIDKSAGQPAGAGTDPKTNPAGQGQDTTTPKPAPRPPLEPGQKVPIVFREFPRQWLMPSVQKLPIVQEQPELKVNLNFKLPNRKMKVGQFMATRDDNSNSQFAIMGLWIARRHGIPMERTLALVEQRYQQTQHADGGWSYRPGGGSTPAMTCVGLMGLAVGHGTTQEILKPYTAPITEKNRPIKTEEDPAIRRALTLLGQWVGEPVGPAKAAPPLVNLYYLWSLERVAMMYNLRTIGNRDWYRWSAQMLVAHQKADGSWLGFHYPGSNATVDTCLALLILRRTNLTSDLTESLRAVMPVQESYQTMP